MARNWTRREERTLRRLYPDMDNGSIGERMGRSWSAIQNRALRLGLRKSPEFMASPACRFVKGQKAWNAGRHYTPGGRCSDTWFKPGRQPQTWLPIGSERTIDGTLHIKVKDTRKRHKDWVPFHRLVWEGWFGRVPRGKFIVLADRNPNNTDISNLLCVSRRENMLRNSYHRYPQPIPQLIQLRGAINRQINRRDREKQDRGFA